MAELTKIFTGMEQGPEKIDTNFNSLNIRLTDNTNYVEKEFTVPASAYLASSTLYFKRLGKIVMVHGKLSVIKLGARTTAFVVPDGFKPDGITMLSCIWPSISYDGEYVGLYTNGSGVQIELNSQTLHLASSGDNTIQGYAMWMTNDDFPN